MEDLPLNDLACATVSKARVSAERIIKGLDNRLLVIVGPCSIHDPEAAIEYAKMLVTYMQTAPELLIIMRVYFEKPRTTVGWKGLINDPQMDGSFSINKGLRTARQLLLSINELGVPCGCEFLGEQNKTIAINIRHNHASIHRRPCFLGSRWCTHNGISNP